MQLIYCVWPFSILSVYNLCLQFTDHVLEALPGQVILLAGHSGSGKSQWLRRFAGLEAMSDGMVLALGETPWPPKHLQPNDVWLVSEYGQSFWVGRTCQEEMVFGHSTPPPDDQMRGSLVQWGLSGLDLEQDCKSLDRLRTLRFSLATMGLFTPRVLLLDNPTASLSLDDGEQIRQDVQAWALQSNVIVIVACNRWEEWQNVVSQTWWTTSDSNVLILGESA